MPRVPLFLGRAESALAVLALRLSSGVRQDSGLSLGAEPNWGGSVTEVGQLLRNRKVLGVFAVVAFIIYAVGSFAACDLIRGGSDTDVDKLKVGQCLASTYQPRVVDCASPDAEDYVEAIVSNADQCPVHGGFRFWLLGSKHVVCHSGWDHVKMKPRHQL